jgi:hypothetical protein
LCHQSVDKGLSHCESTVSTLWNSRDTLSDKSSRFCEHVYPMLPVVSRSRLGVSAASRMPQRSALERCPLHLLAAMYASALRFVSHDEHLSVWHAQTSPSVDAIWRLVYEELQEDVHQSQLSVVQATLLYLHKDPSDDGRNTLSDTPFVWSWVGKLVGLTTSLGINTECSMWAIPSWEKRLRKRIWWAVYAEDKWRSLLMGRPPYIHQQEWDIEDLDASDFGPTPAGNSNDENNTFRSFIGLTKIAESVQETFYSLRAAQKLSVDMAASIQAARPILQQLEVWRSSLVEAAPRTSENSAIENTTPPYSIRFAYHVLVIYIYRALFRPMVQPSTPPHVIDLEEPVVIDSNLDFEDFNWDAPGLVNMTPFPTLNTVTDSQVEIVEDVAKAAIECAAGAINLARRLSFSDLNSFWPSCTFARKRYRLIDLLVIVRYANEVRVPNRFRRCFQFCRPPGSTGTKCAACSKVKAVTGYVESDSQGTISHLPYGAISRITTQFVQSGRAIANLLLAFPRGTGTSKTSAR